MSTSCRVFTRVRGHVRRDGAGASPELQVHYGCLQGLALRCMRCDCKGGCQWQLPSLHCKDWVLPVFINKPRGVFRSDWVHAWHSQWGQRPFGIWESNEYHKRQMLQDALITFHTAGLLLDRASNCVSSRSFLQAIASPDYGRCDPSARMVHL